MNRHEAIFDEVFSAEGGRAALSRYPMGNVLASIGETYRSFLTNCRHQAATQDADIDIYFDFVESLELNATAIKTDDVYLIGINIGTFHRLSLLYSAFLSWPEVLPNLGKAKREKASKFNIVRCLDLEWFPDGKRIGLERSDLFLTPRDETRQLASACMGMMALDFIFTHELGHIINGHLDYLGSVGTALKINETALLPPAIAPELLQALEVDADREGASIVGSGVIQRNLIHRDFRNTFDRHTFLLLWSFATLMLFHVFDLTGSSSKHYRKREHPHPEARLLYVLSSLQAQAQLHKPELEELIVSCGDEGMENLNIALDFLGLGSAIGPNRKNNPDVFYEEMTELNDGLEARLKPVAAVAAQKKLGFSFAADADWDNA